MKSVNEIAFWRQTTMRERRPRFPISSLTLALGVILLSASAPADASGTPPAPVLQGPSSVSTSQPFQLSFYYPKGQIGKWWIEFFHCRIGSNVQPSNDSNSDPFPTQGCEVIPPTQASISPDTGKETIDVKNGILSTYKYNHQAATNAQVMKWYQGYWYVRVRLVSLAGAYGPFGNWHRTLVGSPYIGKPIGIGGAIGMHSGPSTAIVMNGLKPPQISAPASGQIFFGGPQFIAAAGTLPAHGQYAKWACCEVQWQRAVIIAKENNAYTAAHTPPGGVEQGAFPTPRSAWHTSLGLDGYSPHIEIGPTFHGGWSYNMLSPHSHKFGYQYWFRLREYYSPGKAYGPWSAWRSFTVQEHFASTTVNLSGVKAAPTAHPGGLNSSGAQQSRGNLAPTAPMHRLIVPRGTLTR